MEAVDKLSLPPVCNGDLARGKASLTLEKTMATIDIEEKHILKRNEGTPTKTSTFFQINLNTL